MEPEITFTHPLSQNYVCVFENYFDNFAEELRRFYREDQFEITFTHPLSQNYVCVFENYFDNFAEELRRFYREDQFRDLVTVEFSQIGRSKSAFIPLVYLGELTSELVFETCSHLDWTKPIRFTVKQYQRE